MKLTFLTLTMAATLTASMALAQTTNSTTETGGTETGASETGTSTAPGNFGADWSASIGSAMFGEDGATVRSAAEIETQWQSLSEEDRAMVRRDCMVYMQAKSGTEATSGEATTGSGGEAGGGDAITPENSDAGTATTGDPTGEATEEATTGSGGEAGGGDAVTPENSNAGAATTAETTGMMQVSSEQMDALCAATSNL